jgi:hypothetical protein
MPGKLWVRCEDRHIERKTYTLLEGLSWVEATEVERLA